MFTKYEILLIIFKLNNQVKTQFAAVVIIARDLIALEVEILSRAKTSSFDLK